jgi:hypothetical protein
MNSQISLRSRWRAESGRIASRTLLATFRAVSSQPSEGFFAFNGVSALNVIKSFGDYPVDFFGCVFFTQVSRYDVVIDRPIQKFVGIGRAPGLYLILKLFKPGFNHFHRDTPRSINIKLAYTALKFGGA